MSTEECGNCRFWDIAHVTKTGSATDAPLHPADFEAECLRFPPSLMPKYYGGRLGGQETNSPCYSGPAMSASRWCGEWVLMKAPE